MKNIFLLSILLLLSSRTFAQDTLRNNQVMLNEVEITALSNANKAILSQPASIAKLNKTELKRGNGLYLEDALNANVPGVFMERRTISGGQRFNIRGYGNGTGGTRLTSNFDGQGSMLFLNGIPITDAEGITAMDDIDFALVDNAEVIKGPSGTLYGLAIAGVVNLQTQKAEKGKISIGQDAMFGSYGLSRLTSRVQIGGENASLLIAYGHQESDGFVAHTASHKDFVNVVGDFRPNEKQTISTYVGYSNSYDERQGELTIEQYESLDYSGNPAYIRNNAHSKIVSFRAGIGHKYDFNKFVSNNLSVFGSGVSNDASSAGGWTDKNPVNYGARTTFDLKFDLNSNLTLKGIAGGAYQRQNAQTIGYAMVAPNNPETEIYNQIGALRNNKVTSAETTSLFTEWTLEMPKGLSVTGGIGVNSMRIELSDRFFIANNPNPVDFDATYKNLAAPHFAINKVFNQKVSAYASYSTGHKAPVSSYFYIPTTGELNTGLVPEKGTQYEIGTKGNLFSGKLHYQLALFNAIFSDKMTSVAVPLNPPDVGTAYTYVVNRGNHNNKGLELLLKYAAYQSATGFLKSVRPFANFCYSDFTYEDYTFQTLSADKMSVVEADYSGKAVAGVSPVTANAGIDLDTRIGLYANVQYVYRDEMPFTSDGVNIAPAYSLLHAKLGFARSIKQFTFDLSFGAVNITNTQYAYMVFLNQLPDAYIPAPNKINYFGGVNLKYTF